jgi:predicted glutamine amidotransferase
MPISNSPPILSKDWKSILRNVHNGYLKYTDYANILQLTAAAHSSRWYQFY